MTTPTGNYIGRIIEHGSDVSNKGLPLLWFSVDLIFRLDDEGHPQVFHQEDAVTCRLYLEGGTEEKTETALRMARATLKLCGFDPDVRALSDLDSDPRLLARNEIPIRVSEREYNGRFFTNFDIAVPRGGIGKERGKTLTDRLRAMKSKDEPAMAEPKRSQATSPADAPQQFTEDDLRRAREAGIGKEPDLGDIPF